MMIERTRDPAGLEAVAAVMRHPEVWPWVKDDETPEGLQ